MPFLWKSIVVFYCSLKQRQQVSFPAYPFTKRCISHTQYIYNIFSTMAENFNVLISFPLMVWSFYMHNIPVYMFSHIDEKLHILSRTPPFLRFLVQNIDSPVTFKSVYSDYKPKPHPLWIIVFKVFMIKTRKSSLVDHDFIVMLSTSLDVVCRNSNIILSCTQQ